MNKIELKQKILDTKLKSETIFIKEWGTSVTVKELNGNLFMETTEQSMEGSEVNKKKFLEVAILNSTYTEDGELVFDKGDIEVVASLPVSIYSELVAIVMKINGISNRKN